MNINRWIYSEEERQQCWHEQSAAKRIIDYGELVCSLEKRFESLSAEGRERYRGRFEELRLEMSRLAEESRAAAGIVDGT